MATQGSDAIVLGDPHKDDVKLIEERQTLCTYLNDGQRERQSEALCLLARFIRAQEPQQVSTRALRDVFDGEGKASADPVVKAFLHWAENNASSETKLRYEVLPAMNTIRKGAAAGTRRKEQAAARGVERSEGTGQNKTEQPHRQGGDRMDRLSERMPLVKGWRKIKHGIFKGPGGVEMDLNFENFS